MKGVGGAATLGGLAGAIPGAVSGLIEQQQYNKLLDETPAEGTTPPEETLLMLQMYLKQLMLQMIWQVVYRIQLIVYKLPLTNI